MPVLYMSAICPGIYTTFSVATLLLEHGLAKRIQAFLTSHALQYRRCDVTQRRVCEEFSLRAGKTLHRLIRKSSLSLLFFINYSYSLVFPSFLLLFLLFKRGRGS